jgi:hypothetical protein
MVFLSRFSDFWKFIRYEEISEDSLPFAAVDETIVDVFRNIDCSSANLLSSNLDNFSLGYSPEILFVSIKGSINNIITSKNKVHEFVYTSEKKLHLFSEQLIYPIYEFLY